MFPENVMVPPNTFTTGMTQLATGIRDGKGQAAIHASATNDTPGTLVILQGWRKTGPMVQVASIPLQVDPNTGFYAADAIFPIVRRYFQVVFNPAGGGPGLGANFELGVYLLPRADSVSLQTTGGGGGTGTPVANRGSWAANQKLVVTPLTPVQLPNFPVPAGFALVVRYLLTNKGTIYVNGTAAGAKKTSNQWTSLSQVGHFVKLFLTNANEVFIDADNGNEGVEFFAEQ